MYYLHLTLSLFFSVCWSVRGLMLTMRTPLTTSFSQSLGVFQTWVCWAPSAWAPVPPPAPAPAWPVTACLLMTTFELHPTTLDVQSFQTVCIHVTKQSSKSCAFLLLKGDKTEKQTKWNNWPNGWVLTAVFWMSILLLDHTFRCKYSACGWQED